MERIKSVDGLRSFAVLGVIWVHVWMFFGNPKMILFRIDLNKLISFGGVGVDLFFVISGFCMFLMIEKRVKLFNWKEYQQFIVKRWLRIAPAFYIAIVVDLVFIYLKNNEIPFKTVLFHFLFLNTFICNNVLSPHFWSLATEWHFYILLPFLFMHKEINISIYQRVGALMLICMIFRLNLFHSPLLRTSETIQSDMIWYRFIEFGWGIIAARFYLDNIKLPNLLSGNIGFVLSFFIAYFGRTLMSHEMFDRFGDNNFIVRALGEPVLTFGFGLLIVNLLQTESIFKRILMKNIFQFLGRISYSMYLWHWIIAVNLSYLIIKYFEKSLLSMQLTFVLVVLSVICVSYLSYKLFEQPYFKKQVTSKTPTQI